ncbi:hypothetical protein NQ317_005788 [Molorchus minor]|uniref:Tudor domain-containing protein n=1 Tax=Molorchus minor TaxID=1323400 RepID=A0ABQ9JG54_9CUCU|nr:hypothetical protein NQ317_005788 [Molorchus minor]
MTQATNDNEDLLLEPIERIPILPDSIIKNECYEAKIESIYDPSKFWLVIKVKELAIFMKYLKYFYDKPQNQRPVIQGKLEKGLLCIVRSNEKYYRGYIQPVLLPDQNKLRVFMMDYGLILNVPATDVFFIFKKHSQVPGFAIRACLADVVPTGTSEGWSQTDLKSFCALIEGRRLRAKICEIDTKQCILFVEIKTLYGKICKSVSTSLVYMGLAVYNKNTLVSKVAKKRVTKYKPKIKYRHLFPTFEALENGIVPCSLWEHDLLKHSVPLDILYKHLYDYQDIADTVSETS